MVALKSFSDEMDEPPLFVGRREVIVDFVKATWANWVKGPPYIRVVVFTNRERANCCSNCSDDVYEDVRPFANISNYLSSHLGPSVFLLLAMQYDCGVLIIMKASPNCQKS